MLLKVKTSVTLLAVNDKIIELALVSDFHDFEDAVQYHTATEYGLDTILTRNLKDFRKAAVPILTAQQYLRTLD